jgi:hypothetical protein
VAGPVFLLTSGWRSGSTLVQRLLNSSGDLLVWGENAALADLLLDRFRAAGPAGQQQRLVTPSTLGLGHLRAFEQRGAKDVFMPLLCPVQADFDRAVEGYLTTLYGAPARRMGRSRWGFKQVYLGGRSASRFIERLHSLFPDARFLYLVRHPVDSYISYLRAGFVAAGTRDSFFENWKVNVEAFLERGGGLLFTYEYLVTQPDAALEVLEKYVEVDDLDRSVLAVRVRGGANRSADLCVEDREAARRWTAHLWTELGYG